MVRQVTAEFHWNAKEYATQSSAQQIWAEELMSKLNLSGNEQVLDLGCGDGKVSAAIAGKVTSGEVTGIDASEEMVRLAQQIHSGYSNLFFENVNAANFTYPLKFDVIFSNAVLHWVKDHKVVLTNCQQSLKTGGKVLLQMGGKGNAEEFVDVVTTVTNKQKWRMYFNQFSFPYYFYATEDYEIWLKNSCLQAKRIELIDKDMKHQGKEGLAGWFRTTWMPYTSLVPVQRREDFIDDIIESYLTSFPLDELGNTCVRMKRLEVEAVKH
jgi:trans-aconitate methyltransferase